MADRVRGRRAGRAVGLLGAVALCGALACGGPQGIEDVRALQDAGAFAETIEPLRALLAQTPDDPEANFRLGLALVRTGQISDAVFPLTKAAKDAGQSRQAGLILAAALIEIKNFEEAIVATDYVLAHDPENEAALKTRAQAALGANRSAVALDAAERLLAIEPRSPENLTIKSAALMHLGRLDEAETILLDLETLTWEGDPSGQGRTCLVLANFFGRFRKDPDRAANKIAECLARFPDDRPLLEPLAANAYDEIGRRAEATALMKAAFERNPDDPNLRAALARRLNAEQQSEEAESMLVEGARTRGDPKAWVSLAGLRRTRGDAQGALEALDEALALSPASEEAQFARADVLLDLGRTQEAEAIVAKLEQETFQRILRARIALEGGDARGALAEVGPAIQAWPQNAAARVLAAKAAYQLGDVERTLVELREAHRAEPGETDAALLYARIQLARGEYGEAADFARMHLGGRDAGNATAHLVLVRALAAQGDVEAARKQLAKLREVPGQAGVALAEEARLVEDREGREAALRTLLSQAGSVDLGAPENEAALRALVGLEVGAGRSQDAIARVEQLLAKRPDAARLHALRGQLALSAGDAERAASAFDRALAIDDACAPALAGQAELAIAAGRIPDALALLDRAAQAEPEVPDYPYRAAQAALASGDVAGARTRLEALVARHPEHAGAANDLAFVLTTQGESLDRALVLAQAAQRLAPGPEVLDTVGLVRLARGEHDAAIAAFQEALAQRPDHATARYHLGLALARKGDRDAAREALRAALDGGPFPEAEQARLELGKLESAEGARE